MIGKLYIDGRDVYSLYGVYVTEGGYNGLIAFPTLKNFDSNDWAEEDGIEVDLSSPALASKEFTIKFAATDESKISSFVALLADKAYHVFIFAEIERILTLRLVSQPNMTIAMNMGIFELRFSDDFPIRNYNYTAPVSRLVPNTGYTIDGVDTSEYGMHILEGSKAEVLKSPAVKKNLTCDVSRENGVSYDDMIVAFQQKDVKLNCLMRAENLTEFWRNYYALLYNLVLPGERLLNTDYTNCEYPCYYKSCNVVSFAPKGKIWFEFRLTLVFTAFRPSNLLLSLRMANLGIRLLGNGNLRILKK